MSGTPGERTTDHPDAPDPIPAGDGDPAGAVWRSIVPGARLDREAPDRTRLDREAPDRLPPDREALERAGPDRDGAPGGEAVDDRPDDRRGDRDRRTGASPPQRPGRGGRTADGAPGAGGPRAGRRGAGGLGTAASAQRQRPAGRRGGERGGAGPARRGRAPVLVAAAVTSALGALAGWLPVLVVVLLVSMPGPGGPGVVGALRGSLALWLLGHGVPATVAGAKLSVAPLVLSALAAWRVSRAGVHTARAVDARRRRGAWPVLAAAGAVAIGYAALGALAARLTAAGGVHVGPAGAALRLGVFAVVFGGAGAAAEAGLPGRLLRRTPQLLRDALRTGLVSGGLVLAAGAGLGGLALATHAGDATDVLRAYHAGVAGQAGLTLVCLSYAPNLAAWAAAYLIGPGFAVGAGTSVSAASVTLGPLPALPVLAGLPRSAASGVGVLLLGLPVAAGMVAGGLLARRQLRGPDAPPPRWLALTGASLLAGPVAGALLGLAALVSTGDLGTGRLTGLGPVPWQVALVATGVVGLGALLGAAATAVAMGSRQPRRSRPTRPASTPPTRRR